MDSGALMSDAFREICDGEEEIFTTFSRPLSSTDLGMMDRNASVFEAEIAGNSFTIKQSPSLLRSDRKEGTTGAVAWRSSVLFAECVLYILNGEHSKEKKKFNFLELGCGTSGLVALALSGLANKYIATDQSYVRKIFGENLASNGNQRLTPSAPSGRRSEQSNVSRKARATVLQQTPVVFQELDWCVDDVRTIGSILSEHLQSTEPLEFILANDCIYNESLVEPFVKTCATVCQHKNAENRAPILLIGQQLRSSSVYESWLLSMMKTFRIWSIELPVHLGQVDAGTNANFVCHAAILKDEHHFQS